MPQASESTPESAATVDNQDVGARWEAQSWRLTAFVTTAPPYDSSWWGAVLGEEPDQQNANPKLGVRQELGAYGTGTLVLSVQPGRVDWLYTSESFVPTSLASPELHVTSLGSVDDTLDSFRVIVSRWLAICPPVNRLAVGAIMQQPASSRVDAYQAIMQMVPGVRLDTPGCSDFLYQVNRPRQSKVVPSRMINRLSKWSAAALQIVEFTLAITQQSVRSVSQPTVTARIELDINTSPEQNDEFDQPRLEEVFNELVALGLEIARRGDVP